jgi:hypothetical protein
MSDPAKTSNQNVLPVQAFFNLDGTFNTLLGQGQPFVITATESIGIVNSTVNATLYPTFTSATSGQVTGLAIASPSLTWNPGTGVFSAPTFFGTLNGTANTANNLSGGGAGQIVYQNALGSTAYLAAGSSGQFLLSNGTSAPSWSTVATSVTISDQTTDSATYYPLFYSATSGSTNTVETSSTKLQYQPSTGKFTATLFSGSGASLTNIPNGALTNSSVTIGSTSIALGATSTTLAGLTSVTATSFIGALTGNADTATTATNATNSAITDNTSSSATWYPTLVATTSGNQPLTSSSTKLSFQPSTSTLTASIFSGAATNIYAGAANQIPVQSAANTTTFIAAPTIASTVLNWTGSAFSWIAPGTVTSVAATVPSFLSITGSPITSSGTLAITYSGTALPVLNGGTGVTTSTGSGSNVLNTSPALTTPAITGGTISNLTQELINQSTDLGTGVLQVTGQSTFNGVVIDKSLNLQGGNNLVLNSASLSTQNITVTAYPYTLSMTGTGTITLSGTSSGTLVGSGANTVVSRTFTPTAGTLTLTPSGSCTTVQLELGSVFSGYTATTGSAVTTTNNISIPSGQVLASPGTASLPSIALGFANTGIFSSSGSALAFTIAGTTKFQIIGSDLGFVSNGSFYWGTSSDLVLNRDAANILAQRNSTNAQTFRLYNTYTDASNYERHSNVWSSNVLYAKNENAGTGSARLFIPVTGATTVALLPSAATAGIGGRSFVTDALAPSFGVAVTGGGTVKIPVYSDGTSWYVG